MFLYIPGVTQCDMCCSAAVAAACRGHGGDGPGPLVPRVSRAGSGMMSGNHSWQVPEARR